MKQDDTLWKAILEDVFDDFLVFFFKEQASLFNLERGFEFLDKELEQLFPQQDESNVRFVDKLVRVYTKDGADRWVLVHMEVQGYSDGDFAKRMFTYFYRILDKYNKPVTCIAIFTDSNKNYMPSVYQYYFLGTEYTFKYNVYKIINQDESLLRSSDNPFAIVVLTVLLALKKGKVPEEELFALKSELLKNLFQKNIPRNKIRAILIFLTHYVSFDSAEFVSKFDTEINFLTNNITTMGIEEFVLQRVKHEEFEKGREKEKIEFAKKLLLQTDFDLEKIADMVGVSVAFVESVKASL